MTLHGKTDKRETIIHYIVKCLIYYECKKKGRNVVMEHKAGNNIYDVFDMSNGIVYEPIQPCNNKVKQAKWDKYRLHASVSEVLCIDLKRFNENMTLRDISEIVKEEVV